MGGVAGSDGALLLRQLWISRHKSLCSEQPKWNTRGAEGALPQRSERLAQDSNSCRTNASPRVSLTPVINVALTSSL